MTEVMATSSWAEANQAYLSAQFTRLKDRLASAPQDTANDAVNEARACMDAPPAIERLAELFGLDAFEREVLLLCAGVEMDSQLAVLCGAAQGNARRGWASFGLALSVLPEPHWNALTPTGPLRRFHLVEVEAGQGLTSAALRIDERTLHYLAGVNLLDPRLQPLLQASPFPEWIAEEHQTVAAQAVRAYGACAEHSPVIHLCGDDAFGQEDVAALAAHAAGVQLFSLRAEDVPESAADWDQLARLWEREALLLPGALLVQCASRGLSSTARFLAERLPGLVFVSAREPVVLSRAFLRFDVNKTGAAGQKRLWERALGGRVEGLNGTLDALSEQFQLSARMIYAAGTLSGQHVSEHPKELWNTCRSFSRPRLEDLAQRMVSSAGWDDLVVPELQKQILRQLASQVRHRMKVYETWGFSARGRRGLGVSALFVGESGTGKTLAAEVLACELDLDLYRIDLSAVVSKYIGETEKNLKRVFDAAEEGGVMLLFDEADALFGKRGDVRDSHDRYANIEVGYLLQRMESYQGLAILTTNLKSSLDRAFQRRLRFTVNFPFPDSAQREAIWRRVFPTHTPTRDLDPRKLAQMNVAGGNIRNIALNAAFLAAECNGPVEMTHVLRAARLEAHKIERPLSEAEIRGWV